MLGMGIKKYNLPQVNDVGTILPFTIEVENNAENMRIIVEQLNDQMKSKLEGKYTKFNFEIFPYFFEGASIKKFNSDLNTEVITVEVVADACHNKQ